MVVVLLSLLRTGGAARDAVRRLLQTSASLRACKRVKSVRDYYWMGAIAAQKLAGGRKPIERGHRVRRHRVGSADRRRLVPSGRAQWLRRLPARNGPLRPRRS